MLDAAVAALPKNTTSPVWRIRGIFFFAVAFDDLKLCNSGLDPHRDIPVEVLHVVLLGFIKYLWRDAVNNRIGKAEDKKNC